MVTQVTRKSMTPQEKAKELYDKYADEFNFDDTYRSYREQSKQCALIVVNEILGFIEDDRDGFSWKTYYEEVKNEINKL